VPKGAKAIYGSSYARGMAGFLPKFTMKSNELVRTLNVEDGVMFQIHEYLIKLNY